MKLVIVVILLVIAIVIAIVIAKQVNTFRNYVRQMSYSDVDQVRMIILVISASDNTLRNGRSNI